MKDEKYSKLLNTIGNETLVLSGENIELPHWADAKIVKKGQKSVNVKNIAASIRANFFTLITVACSPYLLHAVIFTKQSSTPRLAYKRYAMNFLHSGIWYKNEIKPGTEAWESFEQVRGIHNRMNHRLIKSGYGMVNQKDMALVQFLYIGYMSVFRERMGFFASDEDFENYNHLVRLIGHMLGIEDRFNCCGATFKETQARCQSILEDCFRPGLQNLPKGYHAYTKVAVDGMWYMMPFINYQSGFYHINRLCENPGYTCLKYQQFTHFDCVDENCKFKELPLYSKFHALMEILIFENLLQFFVFRLLSTLFYGLTIFTLVNVLPIFAIIGLGWKHAWLKITKKEFKKLY